MSGNGHGERDLERQAAEKREALKRTAHALEDRLREKGHQVGEVVDRAVDQVEGIDAFVQHHRYALIGGALGLGVTVGLRRRRATVRPGRMLAPADLRGMRFVVERPRPTMFRSLVGALTALAMRQAMEWLNDRLQQPQARDDRRPPTRVAPRGTPPIHRE